MAIYFGIDSNYAGSLFNSLNTGTNQNTSFSGLTGLLSEYSNIQNGTYKKLLTAYYDKNGSNGVAENTNSISMASDDTKKLTAMKDAADSLQESATALSAKGSESVFNKVSKVNSDGTTTKEYDTDKIYKAVKMFVDDYNGLIEATEKSNTKSVASRMNTIIAATDKNKKDLADIGITINSDDTLSIDEKTFKNADMSDVKSLFNGNGSYAYYTGVKASMVSANIASEAAKSNTYTSDGTYSYNYSSGDLYNSLF